MGARIYQPTKTAMQSGQGNTKKWLLEYEPGEKKVNDPLMGWIGSGDMNGQLRLKFATKEEAVAYAERHGIASRNPTPTISATTGSSRPARQVVDLSCRQRPRSSVG